LIVLGWRDFHWKDDDLMVGNSRVGVKIIPDSQWPGMFRVEYPEDIISDMANLTRIRDAAIHLAASYLNKDSRISHAKRARID
jgi:hypothetical protein